jgi:hypothetical protein
MRPATEAEMTAPMSNLFWPAINARSLLAGAFISGFVAGDRQK